MPEATDKVTIEFNGKPVQVDMLQPGLCKKSDSIFYIQDCVTKEWLYSFAARTEKLRTKLNNDFSQYKGRASKAADKKAKKVTPEVVEAPAQNLAE